VEPAAAAALSDFGRVRPGSGDRGRSASGSWALTDFTGRILAGGADAPLRDQRGGPGFSPPGPDSSPATPKGYREGNPAFQQLAVRDQVHAIVGGFRSGAVLALVPYVARSRRRSSSRCSQPGHHDAVGETTQQTSTSSGVVNSERRPQPCLRLRDISKGQVGWTRFAIDAENLKWARDYAESSRPSSASIRWISCTRRTTILPPPTSLRSSRPPIRQGPVLLEICSNQAGFVIVKQWRDQRVPMPCGQQQPILLARLSGRTRRGKCQYELSASHQGTLSKRSVPFWTSSRSDSRDSFSRAPARMTP